MPFIRMKAFFDQKPLFIILSNFPKFKKFDFFGRNIPTIKVDKTVLGNIIIWYAFYSNFDTFGDFEKIEVFWKTCFFKKNPKFLRFEKS